MNYELGTANSKVNTDKPPYLPNIFRKGRA